MAVEESPDWLPEGWTMVVEKGRKNGHKDRYYTNLETGQKFQSKDEVLRYVKMGTHLNHSPQPIKRPISMCSGDKNMPIVEQTKDSLKRLPKGWIVQTKTRKSGPKVGMKYKCYVAPKTGSKFYSKSEVSRYIKAKLDSDTSKTKKRGIGMHSASKVVVENAAADGLPPGWIKEVKVKKVAHKTRRDPYYTDPVSGYIFRSKRDVLRYLQTGEIGRLANKPKKRSINGVESIDDNISPSTGAKRPRLAGSATRRRLFTGQGSKLSVAVEDEQIMESSVTEECVPLSKRTSDQCGKSNELSGLALPEAKGSKKRQGKRDCAENKFDFATAAEVRLENQPLENGVEKHNKVTRLSLSKSKDKKERKLPSRSSKRLAGIKVEEALDMGPSKRACRVAARQAGELGEHPEELKTEKKDDEKADFPFGDSWPDPCLEFAFKTLTGAIPVEDNLSIQDYFQKHLSTPQTQNDNGLALPDFGLDSLCGTDLLVQFDAPEKLESEQQLPAKPTFPPPGNVGLPSSAQNVL